MKRCIEYLQDRIRFLACLLLIEGAAFFSLWLQGILLSDVTYALFLSGVVLLLIGGIDFWRYWKKRSRLEWMRSCVSYDLKELPADVSFMEQDYQELLHILFAAKVETESAAANARQDMLDYYSLWVHQIKTPIAGMRLLLQAQKDGLLSGSSDGIELGEWNNRMSMSLFRIEQYVDMVLSYLRVEDIGKDLILKDYRLDALVNQAVKKFSKEFIYRKIRLQKADLDAKILTDEKWVILVMEQLLSNALKYTREGGCIRIYQLEGKKMLVIEDTGIGIRAEDLPRVFEKGFTGYNGREDKKSTGIGLYLCKNIMNKLNHGMTIESEIEQGTKVYLDFEREELAVE